MQEFVFGSILGCLRLQDFTSFLRHSDAANMLIILDYLDPSGNVADLPILGMITSDRTFFQCPLFFLLTSTTSLWYPFLRQLFLQLFLEVTPIVL